VKRKTAKAKKNTEMRDENNILNKISIRKEYEKTTQSLCFGL
jgi:hypothetical protein